MKIAARGLVGLFGALGLLLMLRIWMAPDQVAAQMGVSTNDLLGLATLRADMAGFFGAVGLFALGGAIRDDRRLVLAPLVLVALALTGRILTLALGGFTQPQLPPILIEIVLVTVFALGYRTLGAGRR